MAVTLPATPAGVHRLGLGVFVRLKLRVLRNGFRGKPVRIAMFVLALVLGLWFGGGACLALIASMNPAVPGLTALVPALGGALLVLGWLLSPLVWFGVDETLNPAKFALLPIPRTTLVGGLLAASLLGVPALATLSPSPAWSSVRRSGTERSSLRSRRPAYSSGCSSAWPSRAP